MPNLIPQEKIERKIHLIRGKKVMLDEDLAVLYGIETRSLVQAVKRNKSRFPLDFKFVLNQKEYKNLRSQFVISNRGGRRYLPYAFTEQGVAMLSSILNSERAIQVNIEIMRTFVRLKKMIYSYKKLKQKIDSLENKYDKQFKVIFDVIRNLIKEEEKPRRRIGFYAN